MSYINDKGKRGEREVGELITRLSGVKYRRVPNSGGIHEFNPWDLMKVERKDSIFDGIGVEVKNTKQLAHPDWIEQCNVSASDSNMGIPKWIIAFNHKGKWYFTINQPLLEMWITRLREGIDKLKKEE